MFKQVTDLDNRNEVYIWYRLDGSLFNFQRLHAHIKTLEQLIRDLNFVDDSVLVSHTEGALQHITSCFTKTIRLFEQEVHLKKTLVVQ